MLFRACVISTVLFFAFSSASPACAHQPRTVEGYGVIEVSSPEVSKAYYAELDGSPATYRIFTEEPFTLYVGISVPNIDGAETDFVVEILDEEGVVTTLDGAGEEWPVRYEPFAGDQYLSGPDYREQVAAGEYRVLVSSPDNEGRYVLAIGEIEAWPGAEIWNAYVEIPELKSVFFGKPKAQFALSVFGAAYVILALVAGVLAGVVYRRALKAVIRKRRRGTQDAAHRNIGKADRTARLFLAVALLFLGLWLWSGVFMAASGFVFFEAAAGWCALYSAIGRNTCPIS